MNTNTNLSLIESECRELASHREKLRKQFEARQSAVNRVARDFDTEVRRLQALCQDRRASIVASLEQARDLFAGKRKTQQFAGITVGFKKGQDKIICPEDPILIDRIEKLCPASMGKTLLDRSVKILKTPLKKLAADWLQKLGISVVKGTDEPVVLTNDDDIEALVGKTLGQSKEAP